MYVWVPLLFTWNYHNIVNRLYIHKKKKIQQKKIRHSLTPANPAFPDTQELKCEPPFSLSTEAALLRIKVVFS